MQKYGEGKIVEKQCPECHETFQLRTAGTHIGGNDSIAVFCDDDPMVCPYCNYTEQGTTLKHWIWGSYTYKILNNHCFLFNIFIVEQNDENKQSSNRL